MLYHIGLSDERNPSGSPSISPRSMKQGAVFVLPPLAYLVEGKQTEISDFRSLLTFALLTFVLRVHDTLKTAVFHSVLPGKWTLFLFIERVSVLTWADGGLSLCLVLLDLFLVICCSGFDKVSYHDRDTPNLSKLCCKLTTVDTV